MDLAEAVRLAIEKTGHWRFAELLDPAHADYNPDYEPIVRALAEGRPILSTPRPDPAPSRLDVADSRPAAGAEHLDRIHRAQRCPSWSRPDGCGCSAWGRCALQRGARGDGIVQPEDCFGCPVYAELPR